MTKKKIEEAAEALKLKCSTLPKVGVVLGSGLGSFVDGLESAQVLRFDQIPWMPSSSVQGHSGKWWFGQCSGTSVTVMQGRFHLYEGYDPSDVVFGVRVMAALGVETLILTNAAGGIARELSPGDLMLIEDHLNLTAHNCLVGTHTHIFGERFVDMTHAYDPVLLEHAVKIAKQNGVNIHRGIYAGLLGPSYETPAEIRMLKTMGADAVGMSTVLETIAARQLGMRVLGISCITNHAAGVPQRFHSSLLEMFTSSLSPQSTNFVRLRRSLRGHYFDQQTLKPLSEERLTHEDVQKVAKQNEVKFRLLLEKVLEGLK